MCRLTAYSGQPIPISQVVIDPVHSLLEQSQHACEAKIAVQGDGFGFAWYDGASGPGVYRDVLPAWSDGNLLSLCTMIRTNLFLAHVRASTSGETSRLNCHPFSHGKWTFMHNGQVPDIAQIRRKLETTLPDDLYAARRGTTDSELLFLLMLANDLESDPLGAVRAVIRLLQEHSVYSHKSDNAVRLTCVLSDGANLYAFRHASDQREPTLYAAQTKQGWTLASEPLDANEVAWNTIAPDQFVTIKNGMMFQKPLEVRAGVAA